MQIDIIRHAESQGNVDIAVYRTMPDYAVDLTESGANACVSKAKELSLYDYDAVYHSGFLRAKRTAEIMFHGAFVNKYGGAYAGHIIQTPLLREQSWGDILDNADRDVKLARRHKKGKLEYQFPGGESGFQVMDRLSTFLQQLRSNAEANDYNKILLVSHGFTMRCLKLLITGADYNQIETMPNPENLELWSLHYDT